MRIHKVTLEVHDDGIDTTSDNKTVKGQYFNKTELARLFPNNFNTAGLVIKKVKVERIK